MRHRKKTVKLKRTASHRNALLANQVCSLIEHERIKTTLAKAKAVRPLAEKMVTLGKRGDLHARRLAAGELGQKDAVKKLFAEVAPRAADRKGGYTRIIKLGRRQSDSAPMAFIEWVDSVIVPPTETPEVAPEKPASKPRAKKADKPTESAKESPKESPKEPKPSSVKKDK